jgi:hypothetical protein
MSDYDYYKFPNEEDEIDEIESETENDMTIIEEENRELAENFKKIYSVLKKNTIQLKNNIYEQMMEQNPFEQSVQLSDNYKKILQNIYDIIKLIYKYL